MSSDKIFLASNSPRRRELLDQIGVRYEVLSISIPETQLANEKPADYVERLAIAKSQAGKKQLDKNTQNSVKNTLSNWQSTKKHATIEIVIGADTAVVCDGKILGKPQSAEEAEQMLRQLSAKTHEVYSAVSVYGSGTLTAVSRNLVTFRQITSDEIKRYVATNEPMDKAGSYAVQGIAAIFIEHIQGSYSAIMGLPLFETAELLNRSGVQILPSADKKKKNNNEHQ